MKYFYALMTLLAFNWGCSGIVAPTNEGGVASTNTDGSGTGGETTGGETTGGETTGGETTGGETTGGETTGGDTAVEGEVLGEVSGEDTDIDGFEGKSTYGLLTAASGMLSIAVYDYEVRDTLFKKITDYEDCTDIPETQEDNSTFKSISATFMKSFTADAAHKVDDNGFPKEDTYEITATPDLTLGASGSLFDSANAAATDNAVDTGTFTFATRPAASGDDYEITLDVTLKSGKKYKGTLKGKVLEFPDNPTAPTCDDGQYAPPIYEE